MSFTTRHELCSCVCVCMRSCTTTHARRCCYNGASTNGPRVERPARSTEPCVLNPLARRAHPEVGKREKRAEVAEKHLHSRNWSNTFTNRKSPSHTAHTHPRTRSRSRKTFLCNGSESSRSENFGTRTLVCVCVLSAVLSVCVCI